jgi:hypothetical protein
MKKYLLIAVAACLCLVMASPALAEIKISGQIATDFYWMKLDAERVQAVAAGATANYDDQTTFHVDYYRPLNYIQFDYVNKDATIGAQVRIRHGHNETGVAWANTVNEIDTQTTHMWWKFYPGAKLSVGSVWQVIGGASTLQPVLACNESEFGLVVVQIGYGNLHTSYRNGLVLEWDFNKMFGLDFGLYDPANFNGGATIPGVLKDGTAINAPVEVSVPRVDLGFPIRIAGFKIHPVGSWVTRDYSMVTNSTDSYDVWAAGVDVTWSYGPLYVAGEYKFGDNLADANYSGGILGGLAYVDANGITQVSDAEHDLWFISARYAITQKFKIKGTYGQGKVKRDGNPAITTDDQDITRTGYGIGADWFMAPNLVLIPEIYVVDRGDDNTINGVKTDNGKVMVYGVQFRIMF